MSVNFGIIGFGFMGHIHEKNLRKLDGAEVIPILQNYLNIFYLI